MKHKTRTKVLSLLLSLVMVLSLVPSLGLTAYADAAYSGGTGTEADPYLISTADDWKALATAVNGGTNYSGNYFKQTANLDMSEAGNLEPVGTLTASFAGNYDGCGFAISGAKIEGVSSTVSGQKYMVAGAFGVLEGGGSVTNLRVKNSEITANTTEYSQAYAGGIAAIVENYSVTDCCVMDSKIKAYATGRAAFCGGIVGLAQSGTGETTTFGRCASEKNTITTDATNNQVGYGGGFVGAIINQSGLTFTDCYSAKNTISSSNRTMNGAFCGGHQIFGKATLTNGFVYDCTVTTGATGIASLFGYESDSAKYAVSATNTYYYDTQSLPVNASATSATVNEMKSLKSSLGNAFFQGDDYPVLQHPVNIAVSIENWAYGEIASTPSVTGNSGNGAVTYQYKLKNAEAYSETVPTDVGDYTLKATVAATSTHKAAEATADFAITKANATVTTAATAKTLTANGQAQELVTAAVTDDGAVYYAIGEDNQTAPEFDGTSDSTDKKWGTAIPTATDVGTYYVWYKVVGDENHSDTTPASVTVTIQRRSSGGGGGSTTTTVTVPVTSDTTSNSVPVKASVSGTTATVTKLTDEQITQVTTNKSGNKDADAETETNSVVIDVSGVAKDVKTATIPTETVKAVEETGSNLKVTLTDGSVEFDATAQAIITDEAKGTTIQINLDAVKVTTLTSAQQSAVESLEVEVVLDAYVTSNGQRISDFKGGSATLSVPYTLKDGQTAQGIVVWYVASDGTRTQVDASYDGKNVVFTVPHFSNYVIAYDAELAKVCPKDDTCPIGKFSDASASAWYHDGVHWALENGVMNGVGDGKFAPNDTTSRAQVVTMLWRLEGSPAYVGMSEFSDVDNEEWYGPAIRWASAEGIVNGYDDGRFGANDAVTREQLVTILYRYAQYKKMDVSVGEDTNILSYDDAFDVHEWAMSAMQWACGSGIINGIGTNLEPAGDASRAQVATMLWRFCK